jgi:hypothetical protein
MALFAFEKQTSNLCVDLFEVAYAVDKLLAGHRLTILMPQKQFVILVISQSQWLIMIIFTNL